MKKRRLLAFPLIGLVMLSVVSCGGVDGSLEPISKHPGTTTTVPNQSGTTTTTPDQSKDSLAQIKLNYDNMKTTYYEGQAIDFTGLIVTASYNDGSTKEVTDYTWDESTFDANKRGDQYVKIIYTEAGITKTRSIHVVVKTILESVNNVIGITATTSKTKYKYNEELDLSDLVVTAFYEDGTSRVLNDTEYNVNKDSFNSKMRGDYEIGVSFKEDYTIDGITRSCEVETCFFASVVLNLDSIRVVKGTSTFLQYSNMDVSNWEVEVSYKEGVKETIKDGFTTDLKIKFPDSSEAKTEIITASFTYNGVTKTATRTVEVVKATKVFNAGVLPISDSPVSEDANLDNFTVKKGYKVAADSQSCGCQSFARSLILDGAGTRDEYSVTFDVVRDKKITVVAASQEGSEIGLYDADGNVISTYTVGTNLQRFSFEVENSGTYYVWSTGGVSIYFIGTYR